MIEPSGSVMKVCVPVPLCLGLIYKHSWVLDLIVLSPNLFVTLQKDPKGGPTSRRRSAFLPWKTSNGDSLSERVEDGKRVSFFADERTSKFSSAADNEYGKLNIDALITSFVQRMILSAKWSC